MYAVVKTGGKQYRVAAGETIRVEKLEGKPGDSLELPEVLLVADGEKMAIGSPVVEGARVKAEILDQCKGEKLVIYKYKRRKKYRRKTGHRQMFTSLKITDITVPGAPA